MTPGMVMGGIVMGAAWFVLGLLFGSLATALSHRLPRDLPVAMDRSRCPACDHVLGPVDLVPLLSWAVFRGRCRYCGKAIGWRYPAMEALTGALFLAAWISSDGDMVQAGLTAAAAFVMVVITASDLESGIIPDAMLACLAPVAVLDRYWTGGDWLDGGLGALLGFGLPFAVRVAFRAWRGRDGLGLGDVKFLGVAGFTVGLSGLGGYLVVSGLAGILLGLAWRRTGRGAVFPLGPALAVTYLLAVFRPEILPALLAH